MKTERQSNANTQLIKAGEVLISLAPNVTAEDRKAAMAEFGYNRAVIGYYLKGKGKELDIAMDLIRIFRRRIEERDNELQHQ